MKFDMLIRGRTAHNPIRPADHNKYNNVLPDGTTIHHNKWWHFPMAADYDKPFFDSHGDRRIWKDGKLTLRPYKSAFPSK